ncbi:MAG: hypothetical protein HZA92_19995 [Verrucomicrobia bacterium]|nr:hypothetical protein [Verrucomicrobiota bacterium]
MSTTTAETLTKKIPARSGRTKPTARMPKPGPRSRSLFDALRSLGPVEIKGR